MTILWYIGFSVLLSMPIAAPLSMCMEQSAKGKFFSIVLGVIVMHLVGVILGFVDFGTITIPTGL